MPELVRMYIRHVLIGYGLSALFVSALLWFNVANLWGLISNSDMGWIAVLMLFVFNGIVFAGVQMGIAVMSMAEKDNDPKGGKGAREPVLEMLPVAIPAQEPHKRA